MTEINDPKAVLDALERAKNDAKKFRTELEELKSEYETLVQSNDDMKQKLIDNAENETKLREYAKKLKIQQEVNTANADRIIKFIDIGSVKMDDEGNLEGLDEALAKIKDDLPELFDEKRRVGAYADAFAGGSTPQTMTGSEMQVAKLFGR